MLVLLIDLGVVHPASEHPKAWRSCPGRPYHSRFLPRWYRGLHFLYLGRRLGCRLGWRLGWSWFLRDCTLGIADVWLGCSIACRVLGQWFQSSSPMYGRYGSDLRYLPRLRSVFPYYTRDLGGRSTDMLLSLLTSGSMHESSSFSPPSSLWTRLT